MKKIITHRYGWFDAYDLSHMRIYVSVKYPGPRYNPRTGILFFCTKDKRHDRVSIVTLLEGPFLCSGWKA